MHYFGITAGLLGAFLQAVSYLQSRKFVSREGWTVLHLMAASHLIMALVSIAILPFLELTPVSGWRALLWPVVGAAGFYFAAQWFFFLALKFAEASQVAPLLGLKIVMLSILAVIIGDAQLGVRHWLAVGLAMLSALLLNQAGKRVPWKAIACVLVTCLGYSLSDLCIVRTIHAIDPSQSGMASFMALLWVYVACGLYGVVLMPKLRSLPKQGWLEAGAYSVVWYASMAFLFYSIATCGVVLAAVLQSSRGLMSIGLATGVAHLGILSVESRVGPITRAKQFSAAALMCVAIVLYVI